MASGGPWDSFLAPWDDPGGHRAAAGSPWAIWTYVFQCLGCICSYELTFSNVSGPSDALALRLCSEIVHGQVRMQRPGWVFLSLFGPGVGNLQGGVQMG